MKKRIGLICTIVWILLCSIPVLAEATSDSVKINSITVGVTAANSKTYTEFFNDRTGLLAKNNFSRYKAELIDETSHIFYADISETGDKKDYLVIAGERESEKAQITIKDISDPENKMGKNYEIDYNNLTQGTDTRTNPFMTTGFGNANQEKANYYLRPHIGATCFEIIVTNGDNHAVYYLVLNNGGRVKLQTGNSYATASNYAVEKIELYNGNSREKLDEDKQFFKNSLYFANNNLNDVDSLRLSIKHKNIEVLDTTKAYFEGISMEQIYRQDDNYVSVNGGKWVRVDGDGNGISQEMVLQKGLNIIQIRGVTDKELSSYGKTFIYGTSVLFIYRENENIYEKTMGEDTSIGDIRAFRITSNANPLKYKEYTITTEDNKKFITLSTAEKQILLSVSSKDAEATVDIQNSTENIGGRYVVNVSPEAYGEDTPIGIKVTPANGNTNEAVEYELYVHWESGEASFSSLNISGVDLSPAYDKDNSFYEIIKNDESSDIIFTYELPENAKVASVSVDGSPFTGLNEDTSFNVNNLQKEVIVEIVAEANNVTQSKKYYFEVPLSKGNLSATAYNKSKEMLDKAWENRDKKYGSYAYDGDYWGLFGACAANRPLEDALIYDIETHQYKQATDYAAVILELVLAGENPYDYNGKNYVEGLLNQETNGGFGGYGNNIWALLALDAAGTEFSGKDKLVSIVANQAASSAFDLDMRGWALIALESHLDYPVIKAKVTYAMRNIQNERTLKDGKFAGTFQHAYYVGQNINTHACVVSGLIANGIDISALDWTFEVDENTSQNPVDIFKLFQNQEDGRFYWKTDDGGETYVFPGYNKDAMIALGDICVGSNVWQRCALTNDKMSELIRTAKEELNKLSNDNCYKNELSAAISSAEKVENSNGFGMQYYALQDALYKAVPSLKTRLFMCTGEQRQEILDLENSFNEFDTTNYYNNVKKIVAAQKAYDALGGDDTGIKAKLQGYVHNYDKLAKACAEIQPILPVINAIDTLPDTATLADEAAIDEADAQYKKLSEQEQKGVYNYSKIASLRKQIAKIRSDQAAVTNVISLINALPDASRVTVADETKINQAKSAYDALDASLKAQVTNAYKLIEVQKKLTNLLEAQTVINKISLIGTLTAQNFADREIIAIEARTLYNALTAEQKALVTNYSLLEDAEMFIKENKVDADIADIIGKIDELRATTNPAGNRIDGPLKETEKNNGVPTKAVWDSWKDYVVNVRGMVDGIAPSRQSLISNLSSLVKAEGYIRQLNFQELKDMMNTLPNASVIAPYTASERVGAEPAEVSEEETSVVESVDTEEIAQSAEEMAEEIQEVPQTEKAVSVETADLEALPEEETQEQVGASGRQLADAEITKLVDAEMAFEALAAADQKAFDEQNTSLVANMNALLKLAETYPVYKTQKLQKFADNASKVYTQIMAVPVTRDTLASVQALLDTYNNCYGSDKEALASVTVTVGNKTISFADVIAEIQKQVDKTTKNVADAREIDEWIMNLPTELTPANIDSVEKEVKAVKEAMEKLGTEGISYLYNKKQLELVEQLVTNYRKAEQEKAEQKKAAFKAGKVAGIKAVSLSYNSAKVTWSEFSEADGYQVYAKSSKSGTYKKIAAITESETICYTHKKLTTGKTYYYKVRAYATISGEKVYSCFSSVKTAKIVPAAVKLSSAKAKGTSVTVKWSKVSGASGYAVYRATSQNGKYTRVGTIKKGSTVSYTDSRLKSKKNYYYKVRAYRTVNGKNVYGSYSAVKKVKTK